MKGFLGGAGLGGAVIGLGGEAIVCFLGSSSSDWSSALRSKGAETRLDVIYIQWR